MADISADPLSWSTTASSNSPSGGTTIGSGLDDNLRAIQAALKSVIVGMTSVAGTNTITATAGNVAAYATGAFFLFVPANTTTGATTLNVNSLGAKNVFCNGVALVEGEIRANVPCMVYYDGTQFNLIGPFAAGKIPGYIGVGIAMSTTTGLNLVAGSTGNSSMRMPAASGNPSSPVAGDIWSDGTSIFFRNGAGVTKTFAFV